MFSDKLRELRFQNKMTQRDLADILDVTQAAVSKYESNNMIPPQDILLKIADYFNVSTDYLLGREDNKAFSEQERKVMELREELRRSPAKRILFDVTKNATEEEILTTVRLFEALTKEKDYD